MLWIVCFVKEGFLHTYRAIIGSVYRSDAYLMEYVQPKYLDHNVLLNRIMHRYYEN